MDNAPQPLLRPLALGDLDLPNRVVMAPMTRARAANPGLAPTALHARYYAQRASAGLIISEGTWVNRQSIGFINVPGIYSDPQAVAWREVTDAVHARGGRIFSQFGHVGSVSHPDHFDGEPPVAPSAVNPGEQSFTPTGLKGTVTPRALTVREIGQTVADYRTAALNARRAGFDGVEIHAQGQHLIPQFLNPRLNRRTDAHGGSLENRSRLLFEILDAVTSVWDTPRIGVKLSPYWVSGHAFTADEETLVEYDEITKQFAGADLAHLHLVDNSPAAATSTPDRDLAPFARYRPLFAGVLIVNAGFTQATGNAVLDAGLADAVAFGAPYIANPDLVERFTHGHGLAEADRATFYTPGPAGYTDYPAAPATTGP
ncbi:alkene reductase [Peterkaempfera bronchialis]|uniref:Alkene reductase n=1 Tax=Peterkaempfera bronchialis TaxID=2126346 RepID=A0A345T4Q8_9ACTN|nr:alkene reductase [Peterkaempfera bronchialis]AXI80963.1 alkene reductase [Peterkaempfera bronchialis]